MELRYLLDLHPALIKNSLRWQSIRQVFRKRLFLFSVARQPPYLRAFLIVCHDLITWCLPPLEGSHPLMPLSRARGSRRSRPFWLLFAIVFHLTLSVIIALGGLHKQCQGQTLQIQKFFSNFLLSAKDAWYENRLRGLPWASPCYNLCIMQAAMQA